MPTFRYDDPGALATLASTELNALANGSRAVGVEDDNRAAGSNGYFWGDFELTVTFTPTPPTSGALVELYLLPALDGSNYVLGADGATTPQASLYVGGWEVRGITTIQRLVLRGVVLPPCRFKALIVNASQQAFPATGTLVQLLPYSELSE